LLWGGLAASLIALVVALAALMTQSPTPPPAPTKLAVLPLEYTGPEENAYIGNLVPLVITRNLERSTELQLIPFESVRTFEPTEDAPTVARQLAVDWLVQGRIEVHADRYQGHLELLPATKDGEVIWTKDFAGQSRDMIDVADLSSPEIAEALGKETGAIVGGLSQTALAYYLEGKSLLEGWDVERNYTRAAEAFSKALQENEDFAEAHAGLALAHWRQYAETRRPELVERALSAANRAVSIAPAFPETHLALGVVQLGRGRSAEAAASFEKAQRLAPADDAVCRRIATAYGALGRVEDAAEMYQRAIDLRPEYWENYNLKGTFYLRNSKLDEAKELFLQVIRLRPQSDIGYNNLAMTHILLGEHEEATPLLEAALRIHPTMRVHNNLGFVYYSTGRFEEAAREFSQASELQVDRLEPLGNLGDAYRQLGRLDEARQAYRRAIDLGRDRLVVNPADSETRAGLSMYLAGSGRCSEAAEEASRATSESPSNPVVHYYAAVAYAVCGKDGPALEHTAEAIRGGVVADVRTNPDLRRLLQDALIEKLLR
jgi:Flp pilus assembly protein TadD/TolB-like protein